MDRNGVMTDDMSPPMERGHNRTMTADSNAMTPGSEFSKRAEPLIEFRDVTLRIRDRRILPSTRWVIRRHQNWAVLGPNGSGKSTLMRALSGETPVVGGRIRRHGPAAQPQAIGLVSLERHQRFIAAEQAREEARWFSGSLDDAMTVDRFIGGVQPGEADGRNPTLDLSSALGVAALLRRPMQRLSNGEMRKILIVKAAVQSRQLLVLDEPFAGLDCESRGLLKEAIESLVKSGFQLILSTHRYENIVPAVSHVLFLRKGRVLCQGSRQRMLTPANIRRVFGQSEPQRALAPMPPKVRPGRKAGSAVVDVRHASVRYGGTPVFTDLSWKVKQGENWAVVGPNGSGKTTLLQLITADHPQAYANEIYLFGRRRGSGESIWEIKRRIGTVSPEFQMNYRKPMRSFEVVLSGFFDSIGLYRRAGEAQREKARRWFERLGLTDLMERRFDLLSHGEKRLVLLARAMVKPPAVLVLDEPCQGLDAVHRRRVLSMVDRLCSKGETQLIYVTHHMEELPACISHVLDLVRKSSYRLLAASSTSSMNGSMSPSSTAATLPISRLTR